MQILAVAIVLFPTFFSHIAAQLTKSSPSLTSLVESERAFAKKSLEVGSRAAFMMFFADDAIVFRPHPVRYKEAMKNAPPVKNPLETTLEWEPIWADVSSGGDLGYTTGPSVWTDHTPAKRPTYYGFYFSFWKKQQSGEWKVVFDVGTELPGPYDGSRELASPAPGKRTAQEPQRSADQHASSLMEAERALQASVQKNGPGRALSTFLDKDARVHRQKRFPIIGIDSIRSYFFHNPYLSSWEATFCEVAASGDLGYTYGSYNEGTSENLQGEKGYFLHAWKRDTAHQWKLVAEITSPLPPESQKQ